jgi:iron complex outermembrane receptor protein
MSMNTPFLPRRHAVALATLALLIAPVPSVLAQTAPARTDEVTITGNPLRDRSPVQPSSVIAGDELLRQRAPTLGDLLDGQPGVAGSGFGPQSSRPVIRGLDGDRVRVLQNGGAQLDASSLSFDHAVAVDPLAVERVEVLRGPATLLYGGSAVGGVVNTIDNRIPRQPLQGVLGRAEVRAGGAARERAAAAVIEGGAAGLNWHLDLHGRRTGDLRVPSFTPVQPDGTVDAPRRRVLNSAGEAEGAALGVSWADARGHIGVSHETLRNDYGVAVEPDITIGLRRERTALSAERRQLSGPFTELRLEASRTRYRHAEFEGDGSIGTRFSNRGHDVRLEARHRPLGPFEGVVGVQTEDSRFAALGDEAFVPSTRTRSSALFLLERWSLGPSRWTVGARQERVEVASAGDEDGSGQFGAPQARKFSPRSASLGLELPLAAGQVAGGDGLSLIGSLASSRRAPTYYELFANGLHVATGAYEVGDAALATERSRHAEVGLQWQRGHDRLRAQVYQTRFANYIALNQTGLVTLVDDDGNPQDVPQYSFQSVPATLKGVEAQGRTRLLDRGWTLDLNAVGDLVRGERRDTGEPLPRLAPWRVTLGLEASQGPWKAGASLRHAGRQDRVPATDIATAAWTRLDLWLTRRIDLGGADALWFVRLDNLTNELAYNASALRSARLLAPMPGRSLMTGLRVRF